MMKEHEEHFAELYRLAQANKMLRLFAASCGRDAQSSKELAEWIRTNIRGEVVPDDEDFTAVSPKRVPKN